MRHLCVEVIDRLQDGHLSRAAAAMAQNKWGFERVGDPEFNLIDANAHVRVPIAKL